MKLYKNVENTQETLEVFELLIRYLLRAAKYLNKDQLEESVQKELPEWRSDYMSIADVLRKEGKEEGERNKAIEASKKMIQDGLSLEIISKYEGLSISELEQIKKELENE